MLMCVLKCGHPISKNYFKDVIYLRILNFISTWGSIFGEALSIHLRMSLSSLQYC